MNEIKLKGIIRDIEYSHNVGDIEYDKANLLVKTSDTSESIISLKFKKLSNTYQNFQDVELIGNVRSYSHKVDDKNKVDVYVFTYFDAPSDFEGNDSVVLDGRICKLNTLRMTPDGKDTIQFIIANNIIKNGKKINSYIPCIAYGMNAKAISKMALGDKIEITGLLRSREYKKVVNSELEIKVAHEVLIDTIKLGDE